MISLASLEEAFSSIESIGKQELSFDVNGTPMTLRTILPSEEAEVQRFAATAYEEGERDDQHVAMLFLHRFQVGLLSHALMRVGAVDFHGVESIDTGESLPNGNAVSVPKTEALRDQIGKWSRHLITLMFRKYSELTQKVEKDAEGVVEFEPVDLEAEISRLEEQLEELKSKREEESSHVFDEKVRRIAEVDEDEDFVPHTPPPSQTPNSQRERVSPQEAPPPVQPHTPKPVEIPSDYSSFLGSDEDPHDAIAAEEARIRQRMSGVPAGQSALLAIHQQKRKPPHMQAKQADSELRKQPEVLSPNPRFRGDG